MFVRMMGLGVPVALGGLYMTGSLGGGAEGRVFDVPAEQVQTRLASMQIPPELRQGTDGYVAVESEPGLVRWKMMARGYEALRVTATITPLADGKAAAVATDLTFAETGPQGADGKALNGMGTIKKIGTMLMEEQIAATVEGRPFDQQAAKMKIALYAASHRDELEAEAKKVDGLLKGSAWASPDTYASSSSSKAAIEVGATRPSFEQGRPMTSARPMVDVSRSGSSY